MSRRSQNKAGVMNFADAMDDFFVGIRRGVRMFLSRQGKNHCGIIAPRRREFVSLLACAELEPRPLAPEIDAGGRFDQDRKSTRLNSSHVAISYAVFCLKKKSQ